MKPAPFEFVEAESVDHAVSLLAESGDEGKVLAGGQSLVPLLNFRLARPRLLVDLNRLSQLQYVRSDSTGLRVGAMTRMHAVEQSDAVRQGWPLLADSLSFVGHHAIRTRGTVGGCLAHADPAAELCAVAMALDASLVVQGRGPVREIAASDFFEGPYMTALQADEVLMEVKLPTLPHEVGWSIEEVARRRGDFAITGVAAMLGLSHERISFARLSFMSMAPTAVRASGAEAMLIGERPSALALRAAAELAIRELRPATDLHASAEYRLHCAKALAERALTAALRRTDRGPIPSR